MKANILTPEDYLILILEHDLSFKCASKEEIRKATDKSYWLVDFAEIFNDTVYSFKYNDRNYMKLYISGDDLTKNDETKYNLYLDTTFHTDHFLYDFKNYNLDEIFDLINQIKHNGIIRLETRSKINGTQGWFADSTGKLFTTF